jgi:hypothetical protein
MTVFGRDNLFGVSKDPLMLTILFYKKKDFLNGKSSR